MGAELVEQDVYSGLPVGSSIILNTRQSVKCGRRYEGGPCASFSDYVVRIAVGSTCAEGHRCVGPLGN